MVKVKQNAFSKDMELDSSTENNNFLNGQHYELFLMRGHKYF